VGVAKKQKKGQKLSCVKLPICPDHPRRRRPLKFCMRGRVREVVIYFKFHENWSRGLRAVEDRKSPSPIDLAHGLYNSLYYRTSRDKLAVVSVRNTWLDSTACARRISLITDFTARTADTVMLHHILDFLIQLSWNAMENCVCTSLLMIRYCGGRLYNLYVLHIFPICCLETDVIF